jgi:hypothetical protein
MTTTLLPFPLKSVPVPFFGRIAWDMSRLVSFTSFSDPTSPTIEEQEIAKKFYKQTMFMAIFCDECYLHYQMDLQNHPLHLDSSEALITWQVEEHNRVNVRIGKRLFLVVEAKEQFAALTKEDHQVTVLHFLQLIVFESKSIRQLEEAWSLFQYPDQFIGFRYVPSFPIPSLDDSKYADLPRWFTKTFYPTTTHEKVLEEYEQRKYQAYLQIMERTRGIALNRNAKPRTMRNVIGITNVLQVLAIVCVILFLTRSYFRKKTKTKKFT